MADMQENHTGVVHLMDHVMSHSNNDNDTDQYKHFYFIARQITGLYVFPVLCTFGIIGSILTLVVLSQKPMRSSTNVYLSALAVSDMIKLINDFLYFMTVFLYVTSPATGQKMYAYLYPFSHFVFQMSVCVSSWLLVSVAVERYVLVCHAMWGKTMCTTQRATVVSVVIYLVMSGLAIPSALRYKTVKVYDNSTGMYHLDVDLTELWKNKEFVTAYTWIQNLLRSVIPLFILAIMNFQIIRAIRATRANKKRSQRHRITVMLLSVIVLFLMCVTPDAIMSTVFEIGYHENENCLAKGIREITDTLLCVNAAVNIILYSAFNSKFRKCFCILFCKCCTDERMDTMVKEGQSTTNVPARLAVNRDVRYTRLLGTNASCPVFLNVSSTATFLKCDSQIALTPIKEDWNGNCEQRGTTVVRPGLRRHTVEQFPCTASSGSVNSRRESGCSNGVVKFSVGIEEE
ncbi:FMRFamide receptor-like [Lingula anatina]|uniref:FMRFamide receptor-like n=1 Tax=Lingula anatina TaxID=7574 RepID=A0A1S3HRT0_LINAN|nr:FMRFamide receptor-like [Lingula anatina]|eukprot:XP_013388743.1 FMRFamide receptor-like [Lingula anatina]